MKLFLLSILAVTFVSFLGSPCWSKSHVFDGAVLSLETNNTPLQEVLDQIGDSAAYSIEITKGWENTPVTVQLNNLRFEDAVRRALSSAGVKNYAIVKDVLKNRLTIFVVSSSASDTMQSGSSGVVKGTGKHSDGSVISDREFEVPPPPENMILRGQFGEVQINEEEPVPPPPEEMLKGGEQEEPVSNDDKPISPPSEDVINQHHGAAAASNEGPVAPPPEEVIRQHHGKNSVSGEMVNIPPPSKEVLMQR